MTDNTHLAHAATLKRLAREGWFREPFRKQAAAALRKRAKEASMEDRFLEFEGRPYRWALSETPSKLFRVFSDRETEVSSDSAPDISASARTISEAEAMKLARR